METTKTIINQAEFNKMVAAHKELPFYHGQEFVIKNASLDDVVIENALDNMVFKDVIFRNVSFNNTTLQYARFTNCEFI